MEQFKQVTENKKAVLVLLCLMLVTGLVLDISSYNGVLIAAIGARIHGSDAKYNTSIGVLCYTLSYVAIFNIESPWVLVAGLAYYAGESMGVGSIFRAWLLKQPLSLRDNESWQIGILEYNLHAATVARGLLFGLPIAAATWFLVNPLMALVVLATFSVCYYTIPVARRVYIDTVNQNADPAWWFSEIIRGWWVAFVPALVYSLVY